MATLKYNEMTAEQQLALQHTICDHAKANEFNTVEEMLKFHNAPDLVKAQPAGRDSIGQQAMWHNNIEAINMLRAYDGLAFFTAWSAPIEEKNAAIETLAKPIVRDPNWLVKKAAAEETLARVKKTINDTAGEKHVKKETILAFFGKRELALDVNAEGDTAAKKQKTDK